MTKLDGAQWEDSFGKQPMRITALGILRRAAEAEGRRVGGVTHSGYIGGDDARTVMRAAHIRQWPLRRPASEIREGYTEGPSTVYRWERLNTSQTHLHAPTVLKYLYEGAPEMDPAYPGEDVRYLPEVLRTENDTPWIDEGHHRIIASRLRGDTSLPVYEGPLPKGRSWG